ncbi:MAG: DUF192 domain-containing protein [Phycisphaerae bacterium]|jgi:uncharacterized protein|nr:DUF192 domain-containing protein [Phycisphaerae bacterium]
MALRLILLCCFFLGMQSCSSPPPTSVLVSIAGQQFNLEVVLDDVTRARGMMGRTSFTVDGGMLFIFPNAEVRSFWMKNCLIDIDLIFLDSRGTITALHEMSIEAPQENDESDWAYEQRMGHYFSYTPARFAIELEAGSIQKLHLRVNDHINLDLTYLKSLAR